MANVTYRFAGIPYGVTASVRSVTAPTVEVATVTGTINGYGDVSLPVGDYTATYNNLGQTYQVGGDLASRVDSDVKDSTADATTAAAAVKGLPLALTGATQPTRYVGRWAATGAPASGTFAVGDFGFDGTNSVQVCTVAGTPGTWAAGTGTSTPVAQSDVTANAGIGTKLTRVGTVLSAGSSTWDGQLVESGIVFRDPKSGRLAMVYVGYGTTTGAQRAGVGLAYSDDGIAWTKYASNPILPHSATGGAADQNGASGPSIFYESGTYYMYYIGLTATGYEAGTKSICLATATTLTGPWTRQGAKITTSGSGWRANAVWHPQVVKRGSTYYLFFNATAVDTATEAIGYATATSPSGPWTVDDTNSPVLSPAVAWEGVHVGDPYIRQVGDMWVMDYYGGVSPAQDGIATTLDSAFPLGWTKYANNPVLTVGAVGTFDAAHAHKPSILNLNGQILHYYTAENAGGTRGIALAMQKPIVHTATSALAVSGARSDGTALASLISQLVALGLPLTDSTTAAATLAADNFTNRSGTHIGTTSSGGQTVLSWGDTSWAIASNKVTFTGSADSGIGYTASPVTTDNYTISVTIGASTGTYPLALIPVYNTSTLGVLMFVQAGVWKIKVDNTVSGTTFNDVVPASGDTFTVTKSGTAYTLKRIRSGSTTTIGTWTGISPATVTGKMGYGGNGTNQPLEITAFSVTSP